jgi:hypothetical protein
MAPPFRPLVLQENKEVDSIRKLFTEEVQDNAPPLLVDVMDWNKQFKT